MSNAILIHKRVDFFQTSQRTTIYRFTINESNEMHNVPGYATYFLDVAQGWLCYTTGSW